MNVPLFFGRTFSFNLGNLTFAPSYLQAGLIILLLFLLVLTMASMRRHFIGWSMKGALFGLFFGFLLALILEGFLIIGGKTAFTEIIGWRNAPKPILVVLEAGRAKLVSVLGISDEIPYSEAKGKVGKEEIIKGFQSLPPDEAKSVRDMICAP